MRWRRMFRSSEDVKNLAGLIGSSSIKQMNIMEVCGTHTMAIAEAGIKGLLPEGIRLVSGPGCPVCVTPSERIDEAYYLTKLKNVIITTYGDMLRVPGSRKDISLEAGRMEGGDIRIVYSPMDALDIAEDNPEKMVIFLGVGFETTAPATAAAILEAAERNIGNFAVFSMHKTMEPAMRALLDSGETKVDGFLLPGHVSVILGVEGFKFLEEYHIPGVISGFEPADIMNAVFMLLRQRENGSFSIENEYTRIVGQKGNTCAYNAIMQVFEPCSDIWRGLGVIESSGLAIRDEYGRFDAQKRVEIKRADHIGNSPCRCGDVLKGLLDPAGCPLFGKECIPDSPVGPCMVSSEGSCAAAYKYR